MISDINANSYLNSENTIEMDNIIKRLEILEQKKGNSVAQQSDGNLEKALKVLEEHYEKKCNKI